MPISADQIYPPFIQPWKKKPAALATQFQIIDEPVSITLPQIIVASHIMPLLPTLPPINHG